MPTDPKDPKEDPKGAPGATGATGGHAGPTGRDDDPPHPDADDDKPPSKAEQNALVADLAELDGKARKAGVSLVGLLTKLAKDQTGAEL